MTSTPLDDDGRSRVVAGLADAISALRSELNEAQLRLRTSLSEPGITQDHIEFRLDTVVMEFLVDVKKDVGGNAGIRFWVIDAGAKANLSQATTHRITVTLHPYDPVTGESVNVSERDRKPQ